MKNIPTDSDWKVGDSVQTLMKRTYQMCVQGLPPYSKRAKKHPIASVYGNSPLEVEANANLIADAGNTYNKSNLLPSELLAQRDELLNMLKMALNKLCQAGFKPYSDTILNIEYLISKIEK